MNETAAAPESARAAPPGLWWLWSALLLLGLIGASLAGALARVDEQRAGIERLLRDRTGLDVRFARLRLQLGFYGPEAVFSDVDFRKPGGAQLLLHAEEVIARFELFNVLRSGDLQPGLITLRNADIYLDSVGEVSALASTRLAAAAQSPQALDLLAGMEQRAFAQASRLAQMVPAARLRLEGVSLHLPRSPQSNDAWVLQSSLIALDKTDQALRVTGTVRLPERLGDSVWFRVEAPPDLAASGRLQLRTRGLAMTPWSELAAIPARLGGALDLRVDAQWTRSRLGSARANLRWHVDDTPIDARLDFDRASGSLTANAETMPLPALQQLWRAFDPAAQVLTALGDLEPEGSASNLHLSWQPQAKPGARARVTAQLRDVGLLLRSQRLQLSPLTADLRADERSVALQLAADNAELRRAGAAAGSGRLVSLDASIENRAGAAWSLLLRSASLGPRRADDPLAVDRPLPPLSQLQGRLRWDPRGSWSAALQGQSLQQPFTLRSQGDQRQAQLAAAAPGRWSAGLRLVRSPAGSWSTYAGRVRLGGSTAALRLPRRAEIRIDGRVADADLLSLQPLLARWPVAVQMPPWRGSVRVARATLGGQALGAAQLQLARADGAAVLRIASAPLAGELRLAADGRWSAELRRVHFPQRAGTALLASLLADQVAASVAVADLRIGARRLGRLAMQVVPEGGGLQLRRVSLQGAATLRGSGSCQDAGDCVLHLALRGDDLDGWLRETGQGAGLDGAALRGELRVEWPLRDRRPWLDSLRGNATLSASAVSLQPAADAPAGWVAGLRALGSGADFDALNADLTWQGSALDLRSAVLQRSDGELSLSGRLDYGSGHIEQQLAWRPHAAPAAIPDALATLESVARSRLPTLAGAVGEVGRWVSGTAAPQRWRVSGNIDDPTIEAFMAE